MAITNVMGFDGVAERTDQHIPFIEGFPFRWHGNTSLRTLVEANDPNLKQRVTLRAYNTGSINAGSLRALASSVFHQWRDLRTKWYFGYRMRCEVNIGGSTLGGGCGLDFTHVDNPSSLLASVFDSDELGYYTANDRYTYYEVCINWEEGTIERWIDGYRQTDKTLPSSLVDAEDFTIVFAVYSASTSNIYSRWTDFYFMVDTSGVEGDTSPSQRLGGGLVRHLTVDDITFNEGWSVSNNSLTPKEILNTPMTQTTNTRLYPHVVSSVAENPSFFYMGKPETGQHHRLGRGDILFVQMSLNTHRYDGSTASLYATPINTDNVEGEEVILTTFVDDFEGRPIAHFNHTLGGSPWTPEHVEQHGLKLYTRSGGNT